MNAPGGTTPDPERSPTQRSGETNLPHVLVVDDDESVLHAWRWLLRDEGFRVSCARRMAEAQDAMAAETPDMVLTDFSMPGGTGLDLARRMKGHPETARVPVVLVSGRLPPLSADDRGLFAAVLAKPVPTDDLIDVIQALIRRRPPPGGVAFGAMPQH